MSKLLNQWRKPTGWPGRAAVWAMNISHAKLTDWGLKHIAIEKHWMILDVGCGGGMTVHKLAAIATEGKVYGIDFSEESVTVSQRTNKRLIKMGRVEIRHGSVPCLPFSDNLFDFVTAVDSHYYWPDLAADVREVLRVLKPSGTLMIIGEEFRGGIYGDLYHKWAEQFKITYRSVHELGELLSMAGYSNVQTFEESDRGWVCGMGTKPS
ncbi:MAG TPA: class I SAM-dependent methyltransferase, partial [Aggregatilineaceae bacterium]|nr:class I SAM-dependent methyltransferase [Aggregatilineaceae bacterium]